MSDYQFPAADVDAALKELFEPEDSGFLLQPVLRALHVGTATLRAEREEMLEPLKNLEAGFMANTHWNGEPPAEVIAARAIIAKVDGETK